MFGLATPVLFGLVGLGVELGMWQSERQHMQAAADIAAFNGSVELSRTEDEDAARNAAYAAALLNGLEISETKVTFEDYGDDRVIRVAAGRNIDRFFSVLFSDSATQDVQVEAAAYYEPASVGACILALGSDGLGIQIAGTANIDATGCAIHSNKATTNSFNAKGSSRTVAECMNLVGTASANSSQVTLNTCPEISENADPLSDPYASVPIPTTSQLLADGTLPQLGNGSFGTDGVPIPGGYYNQLIIQANTSFVDGATVIVDGGSLQLKGNNLLTGKNVTIILLNGATLGTGSQFNMQLSAKTTGPYAGLLIVGDRTPDREYHSMVGGANSQLTGAIYLPTGSLKLAGGSHSDVGCTHFIAYQLDLVGNSTIRNVCGGVGVIAIGNDNPAAVRYL